MEEKLKPFIIIGILILIFAARSYFKEQGKSNEGNIVVLLSIDPQNVAIIRIYPGVTRPVGVPIVFKTPEPMIKEFLQSLTDIEGYLPNHDTVWQEQAWFMEVYAKAPKKIIPIHFYIPFEQGKIVVADMMGNDGYFQSRKLFQWYQTYKDRWLEPDAPQEGN